MENTNRQKIALKVLAGNRGKLIMGRALQLAIQQLESEMDTDGLISENNETSTVSDMKFLRDNLFRWGADFQIIRTANRELCQ